MLFKRKAFFLDLSDGSQADQPPVAVAPVVAPASTTPAAAPAAVAEPLEQAAPQAAPQATPPSTSLTTAEAIAAELAAAEAARPPASLATFAPDCLTPGGAQPQRRRRGGANLAGFRSMAKGMMGK